MDYVGPTYNDYARWGRITRYLTTMQIYGVCGNYNKIKLNSLDKGHSIYIDGRPKSCGTVVGFINNSCTGSKNKLPNCEFVEYEDNKVVSLQ